MACGPSLPGSFPRPPHHVISPAQRWHSVLTARPRPPSPSPRSVLPGLKPEAGSPRGWPGWPEPNAWTSTACAANSPGTSPILPLDPGPAREGLGVNGRSGEGVVAFPDLGVSLGTSRPAEWIKAQGPTKARQQRYQGRGSGRLGGAPPGWHPGGRPAGGGAGRRTGRGKGRAWRASGGDGSAEGRCELPGLREPWREAAPRRPQHCPHQQQRLRPPPRGPAGRRPRAPRTSDSGA